MLSARNPATTTTTAAEPRTELRLAMLRASVAVFSAFSAFALLPAMAIWVPSLGLRPCIEERFAERIVDSPSTSIFMVLPECGVSVG